MTMPLLRVILGLQGAYYVITGFWPLLHMGSFLYVTGPKVELWLVEMVGLLALVIGLVLLCGALRARPLGEVFLAAIGGAAAFAYIDIRYYLEGRLSPMYLADSVVQLLLIVSIGFLGWKTANKHHSRDDGGNIL
jgi:hypothetical protein